MTIFKLNSDEVIRRLEDTLAPNYAHTFRMIYETDQFMLLNAIAGVNEGLDGQVLEYKVIKTVDYAEDNKMFFLVLYRTTTGWADFEKGDWRWSCHIQDDIPMGVMTLNEALSLDGLRLDAEKVSSLGLDVIGDTEIPEARRWMFGEPRKGICTYAWLINSGLVEDVEEVEYEYKQD